MTEISTQTLITDQKTLKISSLKRIETGYVYTPSEHVTFHEDPSSPVGIGMTLDDSEFRVTKDPIQDMIGKYSKPRLHMKSFMNQDLSGQVDFLNSLDLTTSKMVTVKRDLVGTVSSRYVPIYLHELEISNPVLITRHKSQTIKVLTGKEVEILGDKYIVGGWVVNNYTGRGSVRYQPGINRIVCFNGILYAIKEESLTKQVHMGEINLPELSFDTEYKNLTEPIDLTPENVHKSFDLSKPKLLSAVEILETDPTMDGLRDVTRLNFSNAISRLANKHNDDSLRVIAGKIIQGIYPRVLQA